MKILYTNFLISLLIVCSLSANTRTVNDAIVEQMFDNFSLDTTTYEIEILSNGLKKKELDKEEISIKPLTLKDPLGLFTVIVTIFENNEKVEASQVRMRIKKFDSVLITSDRLKRKTQLTTSNTTVQKVEVTNLRSKPFYSLKETEGYRLKGTIQKSIPITSNMLEKIPDIVSGRETTIVYSGSVFKITADGIALQSGCEGDFIKVKNKTSKKIIVARVIDAHHVAVDP